MITLLIIAICLLAVIGLQITVLSTARRIEKTMTDFHQQFQEYRAKVDTETTRLANLFTTLIHKANDEGLSDEELADAEATLAHMRAIGTSPQDPLPTPPATPAIDAITPPKAEGEKVEQPIGNPPASDQ